MSIKLGLTGSIGMGKSTTARMFRDAGCALWDADEAVHRLYARGGGAVEGIGRLFPDAIKNSEVSRDVLREIIASDRTALKKIEDLVHPLVALDRVVFAEKAVEEIIVFDLPLLFENGLEREFDRVVCVTIDAETQKNRVLERGTMSEADFYRILSNQMPDEEKRQLADYVIVTENVDDTREAVHNILMELKEIEKDA